MKRIVGNTRETLEMRCFQESKFREKSIASFANNKQSQMAGFVFGVTDVIWVGCEKAVTFGFIEI